MLLYLVLVEGIGVLVSPEVPNVFHLPLVELVPTGAQVEGPPGVVGVLCTLGALYLVDYSGYSTVLLRIHIALWRENTSILASEVH